MRIDAIVNTMKKKVHDNSMIQIFSCFIDDIEIQNKVAFTNQLYNRLQTNIALYQQDPSLILYNYIDNDEVIVEQALIEMKEEVYSYYQTKTLLVFDGLTNEELVHIYTICKDIAYSELASYIHGEIVEIVNPMNAYIHDMKEVIQQEVQEKDLKFIPFSIKKDIVIDTHISNRFFIQLYQDIKTTLKYLPKEYANQTTYLKMKDIYLLMLLESDLKKGDKYVSKSNR